MYGRPSAKAFLSVIGYFPQPATPAVSRGTIRIACRGGVYSASALHMMTGAGATAAAAEHRYSSASRRIIST